MDLNGEVGMYNERRAHVALSRFSEAYTCSLKAVYFAKCILSALDESQCDVIPAFQAEVIRRSDVIQQSVQIAAQLV
jgi:hypothetical protein